MKKLYIFALVATLFAACVTDETQDVAVELAPETLTVSFEEADSRIQLNEAGKTVWTKGDEVSVFYLSNANQKWQYQGETGERTGNLKRVENATATHELTKVVVVYPYNSTYYINPESYNIKAQLPATQTYLANSYGVGGNIMISQGEYNQFSLKSACGWLKLQLTGNGEKVKSIKLKGNNGEQVAGEIYINSATAVATLAAEMGGADDNENSAGGNLVFDDTILTEVVLDCGEGVELGTEPTAFYIGLPPQTFAQGLTIEIEDTNALKMTKSTDKEVVISRNTIQPMAAFESDFKMPNNEIWYTSTDGTIIEPNDLSGFDVNVISNTYENGKGVIRFDGKLTAIGDYAFRNCAILKSVTIPEGITSIGSCAFDSCFGLTDVSIPKGITIIGSSSFRHCSSLTNVNIPSSVTRINTCAFAWCHSLTTVEIPNSVVHIDLQAFAHSENLSSVIFPDYVEYINWDIFYNCPKLSEFRGALTPDGHSLITTINGEQTLFAVAIADMTEYAVPDNVERCIANIRSEALLKITFPQNLVKLERGLEYAPSVTAVYCKSATPPILESSFDSLPAEAKIYVPYTSIEAYKTAEGWSKYAGYIVGYDFEKGEVVENIPETWKIYYTATAKVTPYKSDGFGANIVSNEWDSETKQGIIIFDGKVTSIGAGAFAHCYALESINIPNSVIRIDQEAFVSSGLKAINIPDSVTSIGGAAFSGCTSLTSITIPDSITSIGDYAFSRCTNLSSVTIGNGLKSIGNDAFFDCVNLTNLNLSNSITSIGSYAFGGCGYLTDITIPESVTEIGEAVFNCCHNLTNVYFKPTTPPSGCFIMFYLRTGGLSGITIYVPHESVETYKAAENWSAYANSIVGYDFENETIFDPSTLQIGDLVTVNGVKGVVFQVGDVVKMVSVSETSTRWYDAKTWCSNYCADWYLPSLNELKSIYRNKSTINSTLSANGFATLAANYWSSTDDIGDESVDSRYYAYRLNFSDGYSSSGAKTSSGRVRAILAF